MVREQQETTDVTKVGPWGRGRGRREAGVRTGGQSRMEAWCKLSAWEAVRAPVERAQREAGLSGPDSTCSPRVRGCGESAAPTPGAPGEVGLSWESRVSTVTAVEAQWTEDFVPSNRDAPKGTVG